MVRVYHLPKIISDEKMEKLTNTRVQPSQITQILDHDADVYDEETGELLLLFRKSKLSLTNCREFYDNVISFACMTTNNRGTGSGSKVKSIYENPKIMTNILGYFDRLSPRQKYKLTQQNISMPKIQVRETRFLMDYPENFRKTLPLIREIDGYYKKYLPEKYRAQRKKADETPFKITGTSFTTITTNVNFQTTMHTDKGDDPEGFGNLVVIEDGNYTGGETCFPQYGVGVDVRTGDVLFMNVHKIHGNLPIKKENDQVKRLSIVCYLRLNIWKNTRGKTRKFMERHNRTIRNIRN